MCVTAFTTIVAISSQMKKEPSEFNSSALSCKTTPSQLHLPLACSIHCSSLLACAMDPAVLSAMHHTNTAPTNATSYPEQANESPSRANSTEGTNDKLLELVDCTNPSAITADSGHEPQLHLVHHDSEPKGTVPHNDPDHEFNATHLSTNTVDCTIEPHAQLGVKHLIAIYSARVNAPNPHPGSNLYVSEVKSRVLLPENPSREIEAPGEHTDLGTGRAPAAPYCLLCRRP
jgi:hypothetical protein